MRTVPVWIPLTLLLLCAALYWSGLSGALMFDSKQVLAANSALQLDPTEFIQWRNAVFSSKSGPSGRPLSMLSFAIHAAGAGAVSAETPCRPQRDSWPLPCGALCCGWRSLSIRRRGQEAPPAADRLKLAHRAHPLDQGPIVSPQRSRLTYAERRRTRWRDPCRRDS